MLTESLEFDWEQYLVEIGIHDASFLLLSDERNEVVRAHMDDGRELLLKRGKSRTASGDGSLLAEGLAYRIIRDLGITGMLPRCILHDRRNDVLMLEFLEGGTVREAWDKIKDNQDAWIGVGSLLSRFHAGTASSPEWAGRLLGRFEDLIPSAEPLSPQDLIRATSGQLQTIRTLQIDALVGERLGNLATVAKPSLIHGDSRIDNIILQNDGKPMLVDLELSRIGNPLYDLGTLIGSIVEQAANAQPPIEGERASVFIERTVSASAAQVRPVIAGYRATQRQEGVGLEPSESFLSGLSSYVGVYMLHRAGALAHYFYEETRTGRYFAVMGCVFLRNPSAMLRPLGLDASYAWLQQERRAT